MTTLKEYYKQKNGSWEELAEAQQDEIERLRRSLDDHLDSEAAETRRADRERDRARTAEAEIERLRTALVADDLGALAYQSGWHARDAEVETLRGLLRNVDDGLDDYWVTTKEGVAWICARHEVLSE